MEFKKEVFLKSEEIYLRALNEGDISGNYSRWLNNPEITKYNSHGRFPMTAEKLTEFVKVARTSSNMLVMAVVDTASDMHIGNISLQAINWIDSNAEIAFLLGEKDWWGKGVMQKAGELLINHGFNSLNLHRIYCGTSSENIGMQQLAEKLGMVKEGIRIEALFNNGKFHDVIEYGIIKQNEIL